MVAVMAGRMAVKMVVLKAVKMVAKLAYMMVVMRAAQWD
jgi:hypothetical protein